MRQKIKDIEQQIEDLNTIKQKYIDIYLKEESSYIYISDHALVRYIERIENILLLGNTDKEKLASFNVDLGYYRRKVLSKEEQRRILKEDKGWFRKDNVTFIVKNLTLITVIKKGKNKCK